MDWQEFQYAALRRLRRDLADMLAYLAEVDRWLARCGRPPNDPLRWEVGSVARHLLSLIEIVNEDAKRFAPYRPLVNPWRNHGLAETLRPDFAARGLGRRDEG